MNPPTISKTDFRVYLDTPLHFWALKHDYPVQAPSAMDLFRMQQGQQVEAIAHQYINQHILPQYENASLLWQQTFTHDPFLARTDALIYDQQENCYDLYEVKSASSLDKEDLYDVIFQWIVLTDSLPLRNTFLVHLNKEYRRQEELDLVQLFVCENVSEQVELHEKEIRVLMQAARQALQQDSSQGLAHCRKPDECPFPTLCHPDLPEHPIYEISRLHKNKAILLEEMGVHAVQDVPADFKLSVKQQAYVEVVKANQPFIDKDAIRETLAQLCYPLHFLDYETCNPALPLFDGYKPNQHITFQYSLHILPAPDAELEHYEFLHTNCSDPAPALLAQLSQDIRSQGSIMVWNQGFEMSRNRDMAEIHPTYAQFLEGINARIFDLMQIFSQGLYIHPAFHGSASIKKVLPALVPDLNYDDMEIKKGDEASIAWWEMINENLEDKEKSDTIASMLAYCKMDTLAMVQIFQVLRDLLLK